MRHRVLDASVQAELRATLAAPPGPTRRARGGAWSLLTAGAARARGGVERRLHGAAVPRQREAEREVLRRSHIGAADHLRDGAGEDLEVEREAPVLDVPDVEREPILEAQRVADRK